MIMQFFRLHLTDKREIAELFNEHFVHIEDGVGEITDHYFGEGFYDHPSIKVIQANNGVKGEEDCLSFQFANANRRVVVCWKRAKSLRTRHADTAPNKGISARHSRSCRKNSEHFYCTQQSITFPLENGAGYAPIREG